MNKTFEEFYKTNIQESSLSRIWEQSKKHDVGTITAFRYARDCNTGEKFTKNENMKNNTILKGKLLKLGYGVTAIDGVYIENYGTKNAIEVREKSFIVIDIKDTGNLRKDLIKLGDEFQQDSITYQKLNGSYVLISTNKCPEGYPGNGKIGVVLKLGKSIFGKDGEFHSKINGRPFVFETIEQQYISILTEMNHSSIRSMVSWSREKIIK